MKIQWRMVRMKENGRLRALFRLVQTRDERTVIFCDRDPVLNF